MKEIINQFKLKVVALVLFVSASFTSCSKDNEPSVVTKTAFITVVEGAENAIVNQELTFNVTYGVENGCGVFNKFIETTAEKTTTVVVETKYEGNYCTTDAPTKTTTYKFMATAAGTYLLKFQKNATDFIT